MCEKKGKIGFNTNRGIVDEADEVFRVQRRGLHSTKDSGFDEVGEVFEQILTCGNAAAVTSLHVLEDDVLKSKVDPFDSLKVPIFRFRALFATSPKAQGHELEVCEKF